MCLKEQPGKAEAQLHSDCHRDINMEDALAPGVTLRSKVNNNPTTLTSFES